MDMHAKRLRAGIGMEGRVRVRARSKSLTLGEVEDPASPHLQCETHSLVSVSSKFTPYFLCLLLLPHENKFHLPLHT